MIRTAESVLLTCCPPAPDARYVSMRRSASSISTSTSSASERADDHLRERRVAPVRLVEGRQAHEPVDAALGLERPIGVFALDGERRGLEAGFLPRARLEQLRLEAAVGRPAQVHAQQDLGPVLRVGAARAADDGHDRVAGVVLAVEERLLLRAARARGAAARSTRRSPPPGRRPSRPARTRPRSRCVAARSARCAARAGSAPSRPRRRAAGRPRNRARPSPARARRCGASGSPGQR